MQHDSRIGVHANRRRLPGLHSLHLIVRKIGAPDNPEFGLGAMVDGPEVTMVLDEGLVRMVALPPGYVEAETPRPSGEIARRCAL